MLANLKVLTIVYDLDVGGTQRAAQNFAIAYKSFGHDSRVMPVYNSGAREAELKSAEIKVYPVYKTSPQVLSLIKQWQPDIIHIHRSGEADEVLSAILKALRHEKTKVIETNVFSRIDNSHDSKLIDIHLHLSKWCLWKWNLYVKKESFGIVLPYLVLPENFYKESSIVKHTSRQRYGLPHDRYIFGRIGQKSPAKFNKKIFLAFEQLYQTRHDIHLFIVGLPDVYIYEVKSLESFKSGAVTLIDSIMGDEELRHAYNVMDCFLHYSVIGESFGMVLAEAQLCEIPIITISTPKVDNSQLEVLVHGETAVILKDSKYLPTIMQGFVENQFSKEALGKKGRAHILNEFTPNVLMPKLFEIIEALRTGTDYRNELAKKFVTNRGRISIEDLKKIGHGNYSPLLELFLIMPILYLRMAVFLSLIKKKMMRVA